MEEEWLLVVITIPCHKMKSCQGKHNLTFCTWILTYYVLFCPKLSLTTFSISSVLKSSIKAPIRNNFMSLIGKGKTCIAKCNIKKIVIHCRIFTDVVIFSALLSVV